MTNPTDYREGEIPNPEGFPCCPKCGEFATLESDLKKGGSIEHYICGGCNHRFPLEEAK